mgnify:CR=1 FL=1
MTSFYGNYQQQITTQMNWNLTEKALFQKAVVKYGKEIKNLSNSVIETKNNHQVIFS